MNLPAQALEPALVDEAKLVADVLAAARNAPDGEKTRAIAGVLRCALEEGRASARQFLDAGPALSDARLGTRCAHALSHLMDVAIAALYSAVTDVLFPLANPTPGERIAVIATGGYGRGTLAPASDIDLLFLLPYKRTPWGEQAVEVMLYVLWDLGLKIGHGVRTVSESIAFAKRDMTIRTSLLEARLVAGDERLYRDLRQRFWSEIARGTVTDFIEAKLDERRTRHDRHGNSRYIVEPNIKESKGGLRDLQTLYWIAKYAYHAEQPRELIDAGVLTAEEQETFEAAEAFLWEVRCQLHFIAGRAEEKMTFDRQLDLAKRFGFTDRADTKGVEAFMKRYFQVAKDVGDLTRVMVQVLEQEHRKSWPRVPRMFTFSKRATVGDAFHMVGERLDVTDPQVFERDRVNLIRLFQVTDAERCRIHPNALKLASHSAHLIDDAVRADPEANRLFLEVLTSRNDPERMLRRMNETGVLGAFIPDFGRVVAMMQFNMYHHYTVDEHLIRAIGHLAALERGELSAAHPLSHAVVHKLQNRRVLYLAVLLHDIAKGRGGDHSAIGEDIARSLAPRLGYSAAETETVAWLVKEHLVFSTYAQSRDPSDPKTIEDFVAIVQSLERLRLLLVLTVVDIRAVGPGVWNAWKGELMRTLYYQAEAAFSGGHAREGEDARVQEKRFALEARLADWPAEKVARTVGRQTSAYWLGLDAATQEAQARLADQAETEGRSTAFAFAHDEFRAVTALSIITPDAPGLFAKLTGAISSLKLSIQDAKAFTTRDGIAFDVFYLQNWEGHPLSEARDMARLETRLLAALEGRFDPADHVQRALGPRERAFAVAPQVIVDNKASDLLTVIEVDARDRPGLLYDLARTLAEERLRISSAHISTFGEKAVDVFYVKDMFGLKLIHPPRIGRVKARLLAAVETP